MRVLLPLIALILVAPAAAFADEQRPTATVRYSDLDLRDDAGVRHLRNRVRYTAVALCEQSGFVRTGLVWSAAAHKCWREAIASAEPRVQLAVAEARGTRLASADSGSFAMLGGR